MNEFILSSIRIRNQNALFLFFRKRLTGLLKRNEEGCDEQHPQQCERSQHRRCPWKRWTSNVCLNFWQPHNASSFRSDPTTNFLRWQQKGDTKLRGLGGWGLNTKVLTNENQNLQPVFVFTSWLLRDGTCLSVLLPLLQYKKWVIAKELRNNWAFFDKFWQFKTITHLKFYKQF